MRNRFDFLLLTVFLLLAGACSPRTVPTFSLDVTQQNDLLQEPVRDVQFSPDGKKLLVLFGSTRSRAADQGRQMYVWGITDDRNNRLLESPSRVAAAAWSPDGDWIAGVSVDSVKTISVYISDPAKEQPVLMRGFVTAPPTTSVEANRVFFAPSGRFVALEYTVDGAQSTAVWEIVAGGMSPLPVLNEKVRAGVFHAGGMAAIVSLSNQQPGPVKFFRPSGLALASAWESVGGPNVYAAKLLSVGDRGVLAWLDQASGEDQLCFFTGARLEIAQSTCPSYGKIDAWHPSVDGSSLLLVQGPENPGGVSRVFFIPDTSAPGRSIDLGEEQMPDALLLSPDGTQYVRIHPEEGLLQLQNPRTGTEVTQLGTWPTDSAEPWAFARPGNRLAATLNRKVIYVWDVSGM